MTKIAGILNITPDSFSDGGAYYNKNAALKHAEKLITDGADVIDIGAQSTRPNAVFISAEQEFERLEEILPAVAKLANEAKIEMSIDSFYLKVVKFALDSGVRYINNVSANDAMAELARAYNVNMVFMHNISLPADPDVLIPDNQDIVELLAKFAIRKISKFLDIGLRRDQIIFDPGIGFGQTSQKSIEVFKRVNELKRLNTQLYFGHSRKSFLGDITGAPVEERDVETHAASIYLAENGVDYIRVHDVSGNKRAIHTYKTLKGE